MSDDYGYSPEPLSWDYTSGSLHPDPRHKKPRDPWRLLEVAVVVQWFVILGLVLLLLWGIDGKDNL